jgi:hypothetical protein
MQDRVVPLLESVTSLVETMAKDIQNLFRGHDGMTVEELLSKLGTDFLSNALKVVKNVLNTIVTAVARLVVMIKDVANAE